MIDLTRINPQTIRVEPYQWALVDGIFSPLDAKELAATFPRDYFKTVKGYDGEKSYEYEARSLVRMGANVPSHSESLSGAWRKLTGDILSHAYRTALSRLTKLNLMDLPVEVNVSHYRTGAWLGPHLNLDDKVVTHVFYFNEVWKEEDGGCLTVLRSPDASHVAASVAPLIGNSVVLVRSEKSWHAVSRVRDGLQESRRSMTVTFYRPGSLSTMWPPNDTTPLHRYGDERLTPAQWLRQGWRRLTR